MANTPQSKKRARQIERRTDVNKARRSRIRTYIRKVEEAIASGNAAEPDTLVASARAYLNALNRVMIERGASAQGALAG